MKIKKYVNRRSYLFVAQVVEKEPAERHLEDVPLICKFLDVFPEDLPGLPPPRQVEFEIELVPEAAPMNMEEHQEHLRIILELLQKQKLYAKFSKCELCLDFMKFLEGSKNFVVYCDASLKGYGVVFMQREKVIAYASRWIELLSDYDCEIRYHPRKANVVADALSRKEREKPLRVLGLSPKGLGTQLDLSTTYHLETVGQSKRTIQTLEDMLRACVINFGSSWDKHLSLVEFSYNNSYHASIKAAPFEALPFKVTERIGLVAYKLELPDKLRGIHDTFHVSNLKRCFVNDDVVIPLDEVQLDKKLHFVKKPVEIMDREVKRLNQSRIPIVKVRWNSRRGRNSPGNVRTSLGASILISLQEDA
uniref:Integrase catalytic domain-containing protein n=1 Tax=Tanacetum cinerariifolium TaxID=118510 RepID=A0A6L2NFD7_TANCI|nr:hypothetical protein [Tanacetum cinerariifolium]